MRLEPHEYIIKKKGDLESITITKEALEKWRDHYKELAREHANEMRPDWWYYKGKADLLTNLLKHFEEEEV